MGSSGWPCLVFPEERDALVLLRDAKDEKNIFRLDAKIVFLSHAVLDIIYLVGKMI